jgi:hypothetical protein
MKNMAAGKQVIYVGDIEDRKHVEECIYVPCYVTARFQVVNLLPHWKCCPAISVINTRILFEV